MHPNNYQPILSQIPYLPPPTPPKRKVFVSYHHQDQVSVNNFINVFGNVYDVFSDSSLDRLIDSMDTDYVNRTISESYITGTSITIVLIGNDTWKRKYIDWEIHSTLDKDHALLGIALPHVVPNLQNGQRYYTTPTRLHNNVMSGYGHFIEWPQSPQVLSNAIDNAIQRSTLYKYYKNNSAAKLSRNLT